MRNAAHRFSGLCFIQEQLQCAYADGCGNNNCNICDGNDNIVKFNATGAPDNPGKYQLNGSKKKYIITIEIATGKVNLIEKEI